MRKYIFLAILNNFFYFSYALSTQQIAYFTGMTFRNFCTFVLDQKSSFNPKDVKNGSTIFVKTDYLDSFCKNYVPKINAKFVLVTHNSDIEIPGNYKKLLNDKNLIAWFGENVVMQHPKLFGIPIGMVYGFMFGQWLQGSFSDLDNILQLSHQGKIKKNKLLYMNFSVGRGRGKERHYVWNLFKNKIYCYSTPLYKEIPCISYRQYLQELAESKFVLSPRGSGWDCYRTWEALIVGSYPIVKHSPLDVLYEGLPVVIVDDWNSITQKFLEKKFEEFSCKTWNLEKLYAPYWLNLIQKAAQSIQ